MRVALFVDPKTAQVTAVSDPLPQILDGVPLRLRGLSVAADVHQFALNLTGCTQMSVTGMCRPRWARVLVCRGRFAASACGPLPFSLTFGESTEVKSMSSMDICVAMKPACPYLGRQGQYCGGRGRSAQAAASRLITLQKACTAAQFEANPAGCPAASVVGTAMVHTPILAVPLEGPVYFVSHGGAKFPDLVIVLQGYGVTIELHGETFISKQGITSSIFQ